MCSTHPEGKKLKKLAVLFAFLPLPLSGMAFLRLACRTHLRKLLDSLVGLSHSQHNSNYTQYLEVAYNGRECKKRIYIYIYIYLSISIYIYL